MVVVLLWPEHAAAMDTALCKNLGAKLSELHAEGFSLTLRCRFLYLGVEEVLIGGVGYRWEERHMLLVKSGRRSDDGGWCEGLWCFNPRCTSLSGSCELQLKTLACGGGCGARYCSIKCQEQAWRDGHKI